MSAVPCPGWLTVLGESVLVVGGGRAGFLPRLSRLSEGSVPAGLTRLQDRPVVVIPEIAVRR